LWAPRGSNGAIGQIIDAAHLTEKGVVEESK
jgi:hypothetical protein